MTAPAPFFADLAEAPPEGRALWLHARDGVRIRAALWPGSFGTAVIFPGRTEYIEKYGRMVGRLRVRGLAAAVIDWRGQGLSDRIGGRPDRGHVARFSDYQQDWAALAETPEFAALPEPRLLFAHSMGGCIGLRTLGRAHPFAAAVFSAPMWRLHLGAIGRRLAESAARLARRAGIPVRGDAPTGAGSSPLEDGFRGNVLTSDPEHFRWLRRQLATRPELGLGSPSPRWTAAAITEMAWLGAAPAPGLPVLGFLGSDEGVVSREAIRRQIARMPRGRLVELDGARHEIWMERAAIQDRVWSEIDGFVARHVAPLPGRHRSAGGL